MFVRVEAGEGDYKRFYAWFLSESAFSITPYSINQSFDIIIRTLFASLKI